MSPTVKIRAAACAVLLGALAPQPAAAIDLVKIGDSVREIVGEGWAPFEGPGGFVQFSCDTAACSGLGRVAVGPMAGSDKIRDDMIRDPEGSLAGYRRGFERSETAKACPFSNYRAVKIGEGRARFDMDGVCPNGVQVFMAIVLDRSHPGMINVAASTMNREQASDLRERVAVAVYKALDARP